MASLADLFNVPREFAFEGKTYPVRAPDQIEQGKFQRWLEEKRLGVIDRDPTLDTQEKKDAAKDRHYDRCTAGEYEWGGMTSLRALLSLSGWTKYIEIITGVDPVTARKMVEDPISSLAEVVGRVASQNPKLVGDFLQERGFPIGWLNDFLSPSSSTPHSTDHSKNSSDEPISSYSSSGETSSERPTDTPI